MKKRKLKFRFTMRFKGAKRDLGLGPGVLGNTEVEVTLPKGCRKDSPRLAAALLDKEREIIMDNIKIDIKEIK